jgi:hypothetical protein
MLPKEVCQHKLKKNNTIICRRPLPTNKIIFHKGHPRNVDGTKEK